LVREISPTSLSGKTVAITRPAQQASELAEMISSLGGKPFIVPTVEINPLRDRQLLESFIRRVVEGQIDYAVFMSVNAVKGLIDTSEILGLRSGLITMLKKVFVIAIGPKTKAELEKYEINVNLVPTRYSSEGIIECLRHLSLSTKTLAILRAKEAGSYLRKEIEKMGANVLEVPVYESTIPSDNSSVLKLIDGLLKKEVDVVTFSSPSAARNLFKVAEDHGLANRLRERLNESVVVTAIGPATKKALEELGIKVAVMPKEYTIKAMIEALAHYLVKNKC